jgi:hypothetical protein
MGRVLTGFMSVNVLSSIPFYSCRQVSGSFVRKDIFGRACLEAGCFLDMGEDIPEFQAL